MPNNEEVVEVTNPDQAEIEEPKEGLQETDILIDINDNITQLSNYFMERNEQLDKKQAELDKEESALKIKEDELLQKEKESALKKEKAENEIDVNFRESLMSELNEISEMPQYESNAAVLEKLDSIHEQLGGARQSDHILTGYGIIIIPAIICIYFLFRAFKNATGGLL